MKKNNFQELNRILVRRSKTQKLYWASAVLFWSGAVLSLKYYIAPTGIAPSLFPGILMFSGAGLYFVVRYLIKYDLDS